MLTSMVNANVILPIDHQSAPLAAMVTLLSVMNARWLTYARPTVVVACLAIVTVSLVVDANPPAPPLTYVTVLHNMMAIIVTNALLVT